MEKKKKKKKKEKRKIVHDDKSGCEADSGLHMQGWMSHPARPQQLSKL